MNPLALTLVLFFASFTQSVAGFGAALVAVPLLTEALGAQHTAALIPLTAVITQTVLLLRYRSALDLRMVGRLSAAAVVAIPIGVLVLTRVDERITSAILGVVIVAYALYALFNLRLPTLEHQRWAYGFGFVGGLLSGAYNIPGPVVVIYGSCKRWPPDVFRSNLQGFFMLNNLTVMAAHALAQHYTPAVFQSFIVTLPGIALGLAAGITLDRFIDPALFRRIVLLLLIILGLRLIF
jgi:uncharacterized membrane protein YfcA